MAQRFKISVDRGAGKTETVEAIKKINDNEILVEKQSGQHAILYLRTNEMKNVAKGYLMTK
jgi:hypothetical protein